MVIFCLYSPWLEYTWKIFRGDYSPSLEQIREWWAVRLVLYTVTWTRSSGGRSCILKTITFLKFIRVYGLFAKESEHLFCTNTAGSGITERIKEAG